MKLFSELDIENATNLDYIVGVRKNLDGSYVDFRYSASQLATSHKKKITIVDATETGGIGLENGVLRDDFFALNVIEEIVFGGQTYLEGDDFTQSGNTITPIAFGLSSGSKIIAKV